MAETMKRFPDESNTQYTFTSADDLIADKEALSDMIVHHTLYQVPRLKVLQEYYTGDNVTILEQKRRKEEHLADHRAIHNFAEYVSQFIQGYMVGVPLKTTYPSDDTVNVQLRDMNRINDADEHNSDLVLDQSIYGRAYELLYRNNDDETRFKVSDVLETFVVYDDTVEGNPILAVRYIANQFKEDLTVYVYTVDKVIQYDMGNDSKLIEVNIDDHYFAGVPIIEYSNNKFRMGDFERVLSLIDLYDSSQSDTANYMTDFNDAMLKIVGNLDISPEEAKEMRNNNILMLQTEPIEGNQQNADADYIYKKYDVAGTEAYKDRVFNNILLFTNVPNLLDDKKSSNPQSGEAMKMKLFGLEQKRATKERLFKKSLRDRYRLINNIMSIASEGAFDVNDLTITFTENLPKAIERELDWFAKMGGQLSQKTMLSQLSFVENPDEELEQIEEEDKLNQAKVKMYEFPTNDEEDGQDDEV